MNLIVGLGNPGHAYARSRHNVGFHCIDYFASKHTVSVNRRQGHALIGTGEVVGTRVILAKPQTFMNSSGEAVAKLVKYYSIPLSNVLVIHDDLDLPLGTIRIRPSGSSGGHKGMQSIIDHLGSQEFPRLRIGIGRSDDTRHKEEKEAKVIQHVLSSFTAAERKVMAEVCARVADAVECILTDGVDAAMNRFNRSAAPE